MPTPKTQSLFKPAAATATPPITRALTICEPFAWAVAAGLKPVENRSRPQSYRGRIAIHAGKNGQYMTDDIEEFLIEADPRCRAALETVDLFAFGYIIGSADLVGCEPFDIDRQPQPTPWHFGPHCLRLANPRRYRDPIPARGLLNLWRLPAELIAAVAAAEAGPLLVDPSEPPRLPAEC
jgi:hypothetical protein